MNQSKTCSKCGQLTPLENFRANRKAKDGLQSACKPCQKAFYQKNQKYYSEKSLEYRQKNIDLIRQRHRDYYARNSEKHKAYSRQYYWNNLEKAREQRRKTYDKNPEHWVQQAKIWKQQNRERANLADNLSVHRRRARMQNNGVFQISKNEINRLYRQACIYCGSSNSIQLDHVIPIVRGGRHSIGNLAPACAKCNQSKSGMTITEWRKRKTPRN